MVQNLRIQTVEQEAGFNDWPICLQTVKSSHPYPVLIAAFDLALSDPYRDINLNLAQPYPNIIKSAVETILFLGLGGGGVVIIFQLSYVKI